MAGSANGLAANTTEPSLTATVPGEKGKKMPKLTYVRCERCGRLLPSEKGRKRLLGQREYRKNQWSTVGDKFYLCYDCYDRLIKKIKKWVY